MPRRREVPKREILPDPKFGSLILARFINRVMTRGKKSLAERIVYGALDTIATKTSTGKKSKKSEGEHVEADHATPSAGKHNPLDIFEQALSHVRPSVEVKSRRVGGSTYQVPVEVRPSRGEALGMRWIVEAAKGRSEKTMILRLAAEILEAFEQRGAAVRKREDTHRMANANKAYAHFS